MAAQDDPPADWAERLAATRHVERDQPEQVCRLTVDALRVNGGGISMSTVDRQLATVCASDETAARIEELQFTLGEGPCVDVMRRGGNVIVADLLDPAEKTAGRWPGFTEGAVGAGVRAIFAFPLQIGSVRLGALDLYRSKPGSLTDEQIRAASMAADTIAVALPLGLGPGEFVDDQAHLASYRLDVHQAAGMIAVQMNVTVGEALSQLRAAAYAEGRPVNEMADAVIARQLRFPLGDHS